MILTGCGWESSVARRPMPSIQRLARARQPDRAVARRSRRYTRPFFGGWWQENDSRVARQNRNKYNAAQPTQSRERISEFIFSHVARQPWKGLRGPARFSGGAATGLEMPGLVGKGSWSWGRKAKLGVPTADAQP